MRHVTRLKVKTFKITIHSRSYFTTQSIKIKAESRHNLTANPIHLPDDLYPDLQRQINTAKCTKDIIQLIMQNRDQIQDVSLFNKAMKTCASKFRDKNATQSIMNSLLASNLSPNLYSFTQYIHCMAQHGNPGLCVTYLGMMVNQFSIHPDVVLFGAIITGFKRHTMLQEAISLYSLFTDTYKVEPNEFIYSQMISIYAKTRQKEQAIKMWDEYLQKVNDGQLVANNAVFGSILNVYSRTGDINGMKHSVHLLLQYEFNWNEYIVADLMRGYMTARCYDQCLETLYQWMSSGGRMDNVLLTLKCAVFAWQIHRSDSMEEKRNLYRKLENTVFVEAPNFGITIKSDKLDGSRSRSRSDAASALLLGAIYCFGDTNPSKLVFLIQTLLERGMIHYEKEWSDRVAIDLRGYHLVVAQLIIRYVFAYRLKDYVEKSNDGNLWIFVGNGRVRGNRNDARLRTFIAQELSSWRPSIKCLQIDKVDRVLMVDKEQYIAFMSDENNAAREKLNIASRDWHGM